MVFCIEISPALGAMKRWRDRTACDHAPFHSREEVRTVKTRARIRMRRGGFWNRSGRRILDCGHVFGITLGGHDLAQASSALALPAAVSARQLDFSGAHELRAKKKALTWSAFAEPVLTMRSSRIYITT